MSSSIESSNLSQGYWSSLLESIDDRQDVFGIGTNPVESSDGSKRCSSFIILDHHVLRALDSYAGKFWLRPLFLAAWHQLLCAYSYSEQTLVGYLFQRDHEWEVIPHLWNHGTAGKSHLEVVRTIESQLDDSSTYLPIPEQFSNDFCSMFDNLFVYGEPSALEMIDLERFPIVLIAKDERVTIDYSTSVFDSTSIRSLLETFRFILLQFSVNNSKPIGELEFLVHYEKQKRLKLAGPKIEISNDQTMASIFEYRVDLYPNRTAIIFGEDILTYFTLNEMATRIARIVQSNLPNLKPDTVVALCLNRTEQMVAAILGVWKAGVAYVALDPNYPQERMNFIIDDTESNLILTDEANYSTIESLQLTCCKIINLAHRKDFESSDPVRHIGTTSRSLSHILYTSGTTGKPKGVMVTHVGLISECMDYSGRYGFTEISQEVIALLLNYVFNAATVPITLALSNGFPLLIIEPDLLYETQRLYTYLNKHGVTHIDCTPSLLNHLDLTRLPTVRRVAPGGEILTYKIFEKVVSSSPGISFFNIYGNSEGTLCIMYTDVLQDEFTTHFQKCATNKQCFVLTRTGHMVPKGGIGEIGITGGAIARGYLNHPQLNAEKFVKNPFSQGPDDEIMFKTGDLARQSSAGTIQFIGRKDLQIKIRGYRVELGDVEAPIRSFPGISASVVIPNNTENSEDIFLVGYYIRNESKTTEIDGDELLTYLQWKLPSHMVPRRLVELETMPLTRNGKIDRTAVSEAPKKNVVELRNCIPRNDESDIPSDSIMNVESEKKLKRLEVLWAETLRLTEDEVKGCDLDFFEAGGNSLLAMRLMERVNEEFGISLDVAEIFTYSRIQQFVLRLDSTSDLSEFV